MLEEHGYSTYMVGKWHLFPSSEETAAGPCDRWPLGRGFERFHGFLGGDTSQRNPDLVYDNHQVDQPRTRKEGYHLSEDLADKAIQFISDAKQVDPDKRFSLHFCTRESGRPTRQTTCRRSGPTAARARSTTAGRPTARKAKLGRTLLEPCRPGSAAAAIHGRRHVV